MMRYLRGALPDSRHPRREPKQTDSQPAEEGSKTPIISFSTPLAAPVAAACAARATFSRCATEMGKNGRIKPFIDKKSSTTYALVCRDTEDASDDEGPAPGDDRVFARVQARSLGLCRPWDHTGQVSIQALPDSCGVSRRRSACAPRTSTVRRCSRPLSVAIDAPCLQTGAGKSRRGGIEPGDVKLQRRRKVRVRPSVAHATRSAVPAAPKPTPNTLVLPAAGALRRAPRGSPRRCAQRWSRCASRQQRRSAAELACRGLSIAFRRPDSHCPDDVILPAARPLRRRIQLPAAPQGGWPWRRRSDSHRDASEAGEAA